MTPTTTRLPLTCPTARTLARLDAPRLDFAVVGLNHKTAPVSVRERATVRDGEQDAILAHLARHASEVMLLATCNRTEVYMAGVDGDPMSAFEGAWGHRLRDHLYLKRGEDAATHLYRVAAGLDSLVLGETQIQGQVKRAWQDAHGRGHAGALLNKAAQGALATGKRVRTETGLSDKVVSVSSAAVELAQAIFEDLSGRTALIVGAGETAELTMTHLRAAGVENVIVVNRTVERARALADKLGGRACATEYLHEVLPEADVVIASSAAPHYVLRPEHVRAALGGRAHPMFLIDISVPRILDPAIGAVDGAYLYNLDDLQNIVQRNLESRRACLPQAEGIVHEGVQDLARWHAFRERKRQERELAVACD
ncbi:glutamyl-tRNA reductase [Deinococcus maricopensis]|uniref:Glutamyl-tRNA reductase n=1 Tax=Deinococcus maricopensis (strain DSM 21211 / LMG 22137 / NRRL B-23946 / LB-34) TaxID=709986 RepID=E8U4K5_DEIML|nr:glutamyl-tRNA reductase [Deinococcus maricopensis]ADV68870.1 Glutamyl-tRNA reductase [Deinococcus maricopensis DSM 21211]